MHRDKYEKNCEDINLFSRIPTTIHCQPFFSGRICSFRATDNGKRPDLEPYQCLVFTGQRLSDAFLYNPLYTENTIFPFPFKLNGIWSWWRFSFRFSEPNRILFGSKSEGKLSKWSYPIQFERKWIYSFLSVQRRTTVLEAGTSLVIISNPWNLLEHLGNTAPRTFRGGGVTQLSERRDFSVSRKETRIVREGTREKLGKKVPAPCIQVVYSKTALIAEPFGRNWINSFCRSLFRYTLRSIREIASNWTHFRLYLPCTVWFFCHFPFFLFLTASVCCSKPIGAW